MSAEHNMIRFGSQNTGSHLKLDGAYAINKGSNQ
ncbi:hypothetical protein PDE_01477 [Penicillium oxalicum 114-2]|uniref:Uncharacterized protein n=1 Tax=Penicillium oxalicum (strain 114-2 / CGMCC 5302) TaxID=933388 RepID=S7Z7I9_PENO1|nr:hypothetical protein PDE_01477 [Penicillium oxalicum 114-2]